ncbi:MAG: hypothetical protein WCC17_03470 [Candidatus Nitrosopolaris sp.]
MCSTTFFDGAIPAYPTNFQGVADTIVNAAETGSARKTKSWLAPSS